MTILCEMEFFNFLWLILVHYLPLPPTQKDRPPRPPQLPPGWGPNLGALHKTKSAPQIAIFLKLASQVGFDPKFNISQIQNLPTRSRSKNWTLKVQNFPKLKFSKFFNWGLGLDNLSTLDKKILKNDIDTFLLPPPRQQCLLIIK